ncbi:F-box domain containing protein [Trema orientale]|uniref:F-box domain containing protein n=1 Tax=Trema orientale TaxID=63057 RepID=A0A2P5FQY3_TREOI|nr:F-box domain containing protein [Trema orientale]
MATSDESSTNITGHHRQRHRSERLASIMRKKRKANSIDDHENHEEFSISTLSDDLLLEIFLRLPNRPTLIQCSTVCKRWYSLISPTQFILNFNQFRHNRKHYYNPTSASLPFEIIFRYDQHPKLHKLVSEKTNQKWKIMSTSASNYLNCLPWRSEFIIRASFGDLLLVSRRGSIKDYCVCNPFTNQWLALPDYTDGSWLQHYYQDPTGYGFTGESNQRNDDITQYKYRVTIIFKCEFYLRGVYTFVAFVFCSETGKWFKSYPNLPHTLSNKLERQNDSTVIHDIVTSNGVLYWLGGINKFRGIIACDPFSMDSVVNRLRGHFVHFPLGFSHGWRRSSSKGKVCLGVVRGQLRLLQLHKINQSCFGLKVWELIDYGDVTRSWILVHEVKLKGVDEIFELAFHPNNGDAIFVVRDRIIYQYEIENEKYEKISEFPYDDYGENVDQERSVARFPNVFIIMQPLWPTSIPELPSI